MINYCRENKAIPIPTPMKINSRWFKILSTNDIIKWNVSEYFSGLSMGKKCLSTKVKNHTFYIWQYQSLSRVRLFVTPWTVAHQALLSMEFSRQEQWSRLLFPSPKIVPTQGSNPSPPQFRQILYLSHQGSFYLWQSSLQIRAFLKAQVLTYCQFLINVSYCWFKKKIGNTLICENHHEYSQQANNKLKNNL